MGPGIHHIRHSDHINHRFDLYADGEAPKTVVSFSSAPVYQDRNTVFYEKNLDIRLTSRDDIAGVKGLYQSFDGVLLAPYQPQNVAKEGAHIYQYYAVDNVENVKKVQQKLFTIDLSPPVTYHNIEGITENAIISTSSLIYLNAADSLSGIYRTYYYFDEGQDRTYTPGSMIHLRSSLTASIPCLPTIIQGTEQRK
jgi:hypothetical protein